jgi:endo-1,4-beta-mannosidase
MMNRNMFLFIAVFGMFIATQIVSAAGLSVNTTTGQITKDGKEYRAVGVNYYSAFYRTLINPQDKSYKLGFKTLANYNVPFARVMLGGYWPTDYELYRQDKKKYFALMDEFIREAETQHIGLIPSLFWNFSSISDLVGEPVNYWGKPESKTIQFMREYTQEVVTRYRSSPAILGWEFGNEMALYVDLPNASEFRPPVNVDKGTPTHRTEKDDLTSPDATTAWLEFAQTVRRLDPSRIISTGNALPRPSSYHNSHDGNWKKDSIGEFESVLIRDNPAPFDVYSIHIYPHHEGKYFGDSTISLDGILKVITTISKTHKKPVFIGEFGIQKSGNEAQDKTKFCNLLNSIIQSNISLASLWVFDFPFQENSFNVTTDNNRAYQLRAVSVANTMIQRNTSGDTCDKNDK